MPENRSPGRPLTRLIVEPPILTGRGSDRLPGVPTSDIEG